MFALSGNRPEALWNVVNGVPAENGATVESIDATLKGLRYLQYCGVASVKL